MNIPEIRSQDLKRRSISPVRERRRLGATRNETWPPKSGYTLFNVGNLQDNRYLGETVLGRWTLKERIGAGSFAWVYRATDGERDVAVKLLHQREEAAELRFAREIEVLRALPPNPHVVEYVDHGLTDDGHPIVVLELIRGMTLEEGLKRIPKQESKKAAGVLVEICEAFIDLHELGVAHRDVKPENILLSIDGRTKLIDFGLIRDAQGILRLLEKEDLLHQRVFSAELDQHLLIGTAEYMAPEQFTDADMDDLSEGMTDTWTDVFSLGVIGHQLLTREKPFPMKTVSREEYPREFLRYYRWRIEMTDEEVPKRAGADPALDSIIARALRRNPRQRQPTARALMQDLTSYLETGDGVYFDDNRHTVAAQVDLHETMSKLKKDSHFEVAKTMAAPLEKAPATVGIIKGSPYEESDTIDLADTMSRSARHAVSDFASTYRDMPSIGEEVSERYSMIFFAEESTVQADLDTLENPADIAKSKTPPLQQRLVDAASAGSVLIAPVMIIDD